MFKIYKLIDENNSIIDSVVPGSLGGHSKLKIFGKLDCPSALRFLSKGYYKKYRVFFKDSFTAFSAGYRPCAKCLPEAYSMWKRGADFNKIIKNINV